MEITIVKLQTVVLAIVLTVGLAIMSNYSKYISLEPPIFPFFDEQIMIFKDKNFEEAIYTQNRIRYPLTYGMVTKITSLRLDSNEITDVNELVYFTGLEYLNLTDNLLTDLDISQNKKLITLRCGNNYLTSLDVTSNIYLQNVYCGHNEIFFFDASNLHDLKTLFCEYNYLQKIELPNGIEKQLAHLNCSNNLLEGVLDLSGFHETAILYLHHNYFNDIIIDKDNKVIELSYSPSNVSLYRLSEWEDTLKTKNTVWNVTYVYYPDYEIFYVNE